MAHLVQSECFLCGKNDVNWKHTVQKASLVDVEQHSDNYWIDQMNWWAQKKAVVACEDGHLFDKACINRYEANYTYHNKDTDHNKDTGVPCPLCPSYVKLFSRQDRKIFVPVFEHVVPVQSVSFTQFANPKRYAEGDESPKTTRLSLRSNPLSTKVMSGTINATSRISQGMPQVLKAKPWSPMRSIRPRHAQIP
jgi:hypothetical protein